MTDISGKSLHEIYKEDARKYKESIKLTGNFDKREALKVTIPMEEFDKLEKLALSAHTDKFSAEKLQKELESCIQTLIEASAAATIMQDIVVGNLVDRKLADLAKTHKLAVDYIEKVTGKNIDVVLAENAALEAEEDE
ncbi:hypothetical protein [Lactococcus lactis]|uniref:hypothetical protein n=1 Tax=Lactococcus lactis TaxID=1358 RepID=UPI000230E96C|nr:MULTISPECIES: hypothetical protein [Lactococcus]EHE91872.1 hypothetical protein LLCRE1631_02520 [Lactococcus lactis subsp. lactis CNCM I-1631]